MQSKFGLIDNGSHLLRPFRGDRPQSPLSVPLSLRRPMVRCPRFCSHAPQHFTSFAEMQNHLGQLSTVLVTNLRYVIWSTKPESRVARYATGYLQPPVNLLVLDGILFLPPHNNNNNNNISSISPQKLKLSKRTVVTQN